MTRAILITLFMAGVASAKSEPKSVAPDFAKLVVKVAEARKAVPGGKLTADLSVRFASDFMSLGKEGASAESYFNAGVLSAQAGDTAAAERAYRAAIDANTNFAPAHANLGELAYKAGKIDLAQQEFETALKLDPKNVAAYNGSALLLFEKAAATNNAVLLKEAVGKLRRALAVDAESMPAYSLLALIYYALAEADPSKLDLAKLVCEQGLEVDKEHPQIYNTLGLIYLERKNVTLALQQFRNAVKYDPKYVEAQLNIGAITLNARGYQEAEAAFKAVLEAKPTLEQQFDATVGMGVALRGQRRVDEAEQWYAKAKALSPGACALSYNLGVLYQDYKSGNEADQTKAKGLFQEFLKCGQADPDKLKDGARRIKDIDDYFKALVEQKKLEEENRKLQEEAEKMMKQQQEQERLQQQQASPPPAPGPPVKK